MRNRKRRNVYCEFQHSSRICENIRAGTLVVSWAWIRKEVVRNSHVRTEWKMDRVAEDMMLNVGESGHPEFRRSSALERGDLKSKGKEKLSIHFCGDDKTVEVVLRTIISVN